MIVRGAEGGWTWTRWCDVGNQIFDETGHAKLDTLTRNELSSFDRVLVRTIELAELIDSNVLSVHEDAKRQVALLCSSSRCKN